MSLADLAAQNHTDIPWQTCTVCHILKNIPETEAEGLRDLLRSTMRYSEISELIAADLDTPLQIDRGTLSRHARGNCGVRPILRPLKKKKRS